MHLAFQVLRWPLGGFLYAVAILLYENQERVVQNRLEELWIWAVDRKDTELSRAARFVQGVARLTNRAFDNVLGKRLWSLQAVGVSLWFSLASMFLTVLVTAHIPRFARSVPTLNLVLSVIVFIGLGLFPFLAGRLWAFVMWTLAVLILLFRSSGFVSFVIHRYGYAPVLDVLVVVLMILLVSFGFDVLYISITRWMLRRMFQVRQLHELIGLIVLDILLAVVLVYGPIEIAMLTAVNSHLVGMIAGSAVVVMFNFGDFIACSVFFIVMLAVLVHRLMWPIVERHIYALQRYDLIRRKWALLSVATALWFGPAGMKAIMQFVH